MRCLACPSGKFSAPLIDNLGSTYICEACPLGTSQPSGGQQQCLPCGQGEYQDESGRGSQGMHEAPGQWSLVERLRSWPRCPSGSRTLGQGASFAADCGCEEGRCKISLECLIHRVGKGLLPRKIHAQMTSEPHQISLRPYVLCPTSFTSYPAQITESLEERPKS